MNGPAPTLPLEIPCPAGAFSEWQDGQNGHFIDIQIADGLIEVEIQNYGTLKVTQGFTQDIARGIKRLRVRAAIAQTVQIAVGDDRTRDNRVGVGGTVIVEPLADRLYNSDAVAGAVSGAVFPAGLTKIIDGVAGFKIRVFGYNLSLPVANDVQFYEEDGSGNAPVSARGYGVIGGDEVDQPVFECGPGKQLDIWLLNAGILSVQVRYELVPV